MLFNVITDRHFRFVTSLIIATVVFLLNLHSKTKVELLIWGWVSFAVTYLLFSWIVISFYHPIDVKKQATKEDTTGSFIFLLVLTGAVCSLAGIFLLLKTIPAGHNKPINVQVVLSFASIFCSWILIHTLFTLRYAHMYYSTNDLKNEKTSIGSGLNFPGEKHPDYIDFAYFSFVLGMTFQVSDVEVTSRHIRRLALLHSCLSFLYNTIILALSINIISGIISNK